jgi:hypothetical protein
MKEPETAARVEGETSSRRVPRGRRAARRNGPRGRMPGRPTMEQFLMENASSLTFFGVTLGVFLSRKFLILPVAVGLMLAQEHLAKAGLDRARRSLRG